MNAFFDSYDLLKPWRDSSNEMPIEVREHFKANEIGVRLQHLQFERDRLRQAYDSSLAKILDHEKNLMRSLRELGEPHKESE